MTNKLRLRGPLCGLAFGILLCILTPWNAAVLGNTPFGGGHFPLAPFFLIAWLFFLSALGKRFTGRVLFSGIELLCIWLVCTIFTGIAYAGLTQTFFVNTTAPDFFSRDGFRWTQTLSELLPQGWRPANPDITETLYNGLPNGRSMGFMTLLSSIPWAQWSIPLLSWGSFILTVYLVLFCLARLLGHQWVTNERMNFPLLRVPQLMGEHLAEDTPEPWISNGFLLSGLALPLFLHALNGLHAYMPSVPEIQTLILAGDYFPKFGLFSGFHKLKLSIVLAFIGFAFFTPRQISFSLWFFFLWAGLLSGILSVAGLNAPESALGVTFGPEFSRPEQAQSIGAAIVFAFFILWLARRELLAIFTQFLPGHKDVQAPPLLAGLGFLLGLFLLTGWGIWFRLPPLTAIVLPLCAVILLLVVSRLICQGGLPYFILTVTPLDALIGCFGSSFLGQAGLAGSAVMQKVLFVDLRESLLPTLFHGEKIASGHPSARAMRLLLTLIIPLAAILGLCIMLALCYKYGLRDMNADWAVRSTLAVHENIQRILDSPPAPNSWTIGFTIAGMCTMFVLILCYWRFPWWPLHPIGFLAAYDASMRILWFSLFLGWLCNHLCLHYGGAILFRRLRFFFAGLILGDFLMGGFWALIGIFFGPGYSIFPL
ncbi:hypothetical protein LWC08_06835 [Desulfobaculum bizertense]|uniref:DUF6785 family protein n=1 Tax=Desulfobaculum bizertense TaxID=376490 RepID=UPI001F32267C|nr:DUF6785 family protein [Desulfobaculum bizertense]UIJ39277.1 hypothetical protein LWC08_06835 [Desulfobaculum bizertense]